MGTSKDRAPTPKPATQRPIMIWYQWCSDEIMTMLPTAKMQHHNVTEGFRPMKSAMGAATRAPINVPIES